MASNASAVATSQTLQLQVEKVDFYTRLTCDSHDKQRIQGAFKNIQTYSNTDLELYALNLTDEDLAEITLLITTNSITMYTISLFNNLITNVSTITENFCNLTSLELGKNRITKLPDTIGQLTNLEELRIGHNSLSELPTQFSNLKKLKRLSLNDNCFAAVPTPLQSIEGLEQLNLSRNKLRDMPISFCIDWKNLQLLDITSNKLTRNQRVAISKICTEILSIQQISI
ncbi:MAG: hypothetical protein P0S94_01640 [Simkaniaceae bacterium]|nr:hypothetical protein [Simkaniaceae bacterium]